MTLLESADVRLAPRPAAAPAAPAAPADTAAGWVEVCDLDDLVADRGVCALVDGDAVAVFRCWPHDEVFAIGNHDPYSDASVLSRGIVGSIGDRPVVASPIFKQRFDLRTGRSLDDETVGVPVYAVDVSGGRVRVARAMAELTSE